MQGSSIHRSRGGLSVAAFVIVLFVPLIVGWVVERLAYGDARATETIVAPLCGSAPRPAAAVKLAGGKSPAAMESPEPTEAEMAAPVAASPKR